MSSSAKYLLMSQSKYLEKLNEISLDERKKSIKEIEDSEDSSINLTSDNKFENDNQSKNDEFENNIISPECNREVSRLIGHCKPCNSQHFKDNFCKWTSGDLDIDKIIQESQLELMKFRNYRMD
ncbi:8307_t:CDS:2 [Gigaspora margarita]|uniref:8307_t:CDS:1 n=1 Tax=Gigaspora margarita TaxID=4874 RepID=A0ABN7UUY2_GIGMA|nr:8307_t:CDS:2 [Gigaspora margarita]